MSDFYCIRINLSIVDKLALWAAASMIALSYPAMTTDSVEEVIGIEDDPSVEDCLAMIVGRNIWGGCEVKDIIIEVSV